MLSARETHSALRRNPGLAKAGEATEDVRVRRLPRGFRRFLCPLRGDRSEAWAYHRGSQPLEAPAAGNRPTRGAATARHSPRGTGLPGQNETGSVRRVVPAAQESTGEADRGAILKFLLSGIRFYRAAISPLRPPACRFVPSCSAYALEALERHGTLRGSRLTLRRLCRCHPLGGKGFDPVPRGHAR